MQETSQVEWLSCRWSIICNSGQFKIDSISNCLNSGSDGEKRGAMSAKRARQFCTRWSLAKSLLAMLFSSELQ